MIQHTPREGSMRTAALKREIDFFRAWTLFPVAGKIPRCEVVEVGFEISRHGELLSLGKGWMIDRHAGADTQSDSILNLGFLWCNAMEVIALQNHVFPRFKRLKRQANRH